jgi:hypothetical protein
MQQLEILNSEAHRHLRVRSPQATPHFVAIVASEFSSAATCCPILLNKSPETGRFYAGAMFGFRPGENLVSGEPGTASGFQPLEIERQGFFVSGENIAIDVESPRFSDSEGEPLFDENGEASEPLRRIQRALGLLVAGTEETDAFIRSVLEQRLVEPIDITLSFDDGEKLHLEGLYTVSLDSIAELDDAAALSLFRRGHLQLAYTMAGSLRQIPVLANRRNERLASGAQL